MKLPEKIYAYSGQILTFASMLLPIIFVKTEAISLLLYVSGVANILVLMISLSSAQLIPKFSSLRRVAISWGASLLVLLVITLILFIGYLFDVFNRYKYWYYVSFLAILLASAQAIYQMVLAFLVKSGSLMVKHIFLMRFRYGAGLFLLTIISLIFNMEGEGLIFSYVFASIFAVLKNLKTLILNFVPFFSRWKFMLILILCLRYVYGSMAIVAGNVVSTFSFHITTFSIVNVGSYQGCWAVVLRISGGVATTITQLISPIHDAQLSQALREKNHQVAAGQQIKCLKVGLYMGFLSFAANIISSLWVFYSDGGLGVDFPAFVMAVFIFSMSIGLLGISAKHVPLIGEDKFYLLFSVLKLGVSFFGYFNFSGLALIYFLSILEFSCVVLSIVYVRVVLKGRLS